jgi:hypothetical protein
MAGVVLLGGAEAGIGQTQSSPQRSQARPSQPYKPGMGDLMNLSVQTRHVKLGLAGREKNWDYAAYAVHELEEALETIEKTWPRWEKLPITDMIKATIEQPIHAVEEAVKARDAERFDVAFRQLTEACNACHQSANRGMIVIRVPDTSPYPNQEFRPPSR